MTPHSPHIYEVRSEASARTQSHGVRSSLPEAEALLSDELARWGRPPDRRFWIENIDTTGLWQVPPQPTPRDRFTAHIAKTSTERTWTKTHVEIREGERLIASYNRNYNMLDTFEPFRQGDRTFALVSPNYTATSVMDLDTGEIIGGEDPDSYGFCPVGFYVPDWWDVHDGSVLPGTLRWRPEDHEWPSGQAGFVWGCVWGDDSSWKVQHLDLSRAAQGVIKRDDRYGYLKLFTDPQLDVRGHVIQCSSWEGQHRVRFALEQGYDMSSGSAVADEDW